MVKYLSKFVLEVLPSVVATVIGAYIVAHYINPRTPGTPKAVIESAGDAETSGAAEVKAADAKPAESKSADAKPLEAKPAEAKAIEAKSSDAKAVEAARDEPPKSRDVKPKPVELVRQQAALKPATEERSANDLARAAIERLRGPVDGANTTGSTQSAAPQAARVTTDQPPAPTAQEQARSPVQPTLPRAPAPAATASMVAPLPPPVIVASPYYGRKPAEQATPPEGEPAPVSATAPAPNRPVPPADIPVSPPRYEMQAQSAPVENASLAEHVLSTTKSFFRALTPN